MYISKKDIHTISTLWFLADSKSCNKCDDKEMNDYWKNITNNCKKLEDKMRKQFESQKKNAIKKKWPLTGRYSI